MRVCILISGKASTASAIIRAYKNSPSVEIVCAIASNLDAGVPNLIGAGLDENAVSVISPKLMATQLQFGEAILNVCKKFNVDLIAQYGWLAKTPANVIESYKDMIINQHPGPLDPSRNMDFGGKNMFGSRVHSARLDFVKETKKNFWTEATCHRVTNEYDRGAIIDRVEVPISENDTVDSLAAKVLVEEHKLHIKVLEDFAEKRIKEWQRPDPLVKLWEEKILIKAKERAIELYPKG